MPANGKIGKIGWAFGALVVLYVLLGYTQVPFLLILVVQAALYVTGAWLAIRLARGVVQRMLWRLRNRLIVVYLFIALVPIVLILLLVGLGGALIAGQVSIHLLTSELERRTQSLQNSLEFLSRNGRDRSEWFGAMAPDLERRYPGVEILLDEKGKRFTFPDDAGLDRIPEALPAARGLALRDGSLIGWAYATGPGRRILAVFPITREYLGRLAPGIGESMVLDLNNDKALLHRSLSDEEVSLNRLPPATNRFDFEIRWGAPVPVTLWDANFRTANEWLTIRTRPSAVMRTVFAQKVEATNELVYITFVSVAILFLIAEIIALVVGLSLTRTVTGVVHELYEGTLRVRGGDFSHRIPIHGQDQLAELGVSFNQMTQNMERLLKGEKERERLQAELAIAREVQNQLYPKTVPTMTTLRLCAECNPARTVSGDYYDYQSIGNGQVALAIGDVAGKGISAALLMATIQSSFRSQIRLTLETAAAASGSDGEEGGSGETTSVLVSKLNRQLHADTSPEKFATFYVGIYDEATGVLTYTNAGHLPPILVRNGAATRLDVNGMVVGAFPFARYTQSQLHLAPGDLVVLFTDGVSEPENAYGEQFSEERLIELMTRNCHLPESELIDCLMSAVRQWTGAGELQDDMTVLLVRRH